MAVQREFQRRFGSNSLPPTLRDDNTVVDLTTLSQADVEYRLTVTGIRDLAGNPVAPPDMLVNPAVTTFNGIAPANLDEHIDSDGDGFADWFEMLGWDITIELANGTVTQGYVTSDPYNADTDGDGLDDSEENARSLDPRTDDTDADLVPDIEEVYEWRSNPCDQDDDDDPEADADAVLVDTGTTNPEVTRFTAHVEQLSQQSANGDADAQKQLRRLLLSIDAGLLVPIDPDGEEARKTARHFAKRLGYNDVSTDDMLGYITRLQDVSRPPRDDATDAFDVLNDQISDITHKEDPAPRDELENRLDNIEKLAQDFSDLGAPELSKAIFELDEVLRDIALDDKVDGLIDLGESVEEPEMGNLVDGFTWLARHLDGIETDDDLDRAIGILKNLPGVEDGVDPDDLEQVEEEWEAEPEPA